MPSTILLFLLPLIWRSILWVFCWCMALRVHWYAPGGAAFYGARDAVRCLYLTGHATRWQDLRDSTYQQWLL